MWFMSPRVARAVAPAVAGAGRSSVFSSPAANSGWPFFEPDPVVQVDHVDARDAAVRRTRSGRKPTIQPSTAGRCSLRSIAIVFWPG